MRRLALVLTLVPCLSRAQESVRVQNFPKVQEVSGTVSLRGSARIEGRTDATRFVAFENREVPPLIGTPSVRDYQFAGSLNAEGFGSVVLTVAAWVPAGASDGRVGMLLVPDVAFAREALDRDGVAPIGLPVEAEITRSIAGRTVAVSSERLPLAFPRWRVYLFNTTSSTLKTQAYAMLGD